MIKHTMALALSLTAIILPPAAHAATQVNLDTNETWTVKVQSPNDEVEPNAVVPTSVPGTYNGGATNPGVNGAFWISPSSATTHPPLTTFSFTKIFALPALADFSSAVLSGSYWSDNGIVSILLNGITILGPNDPNSVNQSATFVQGPGTALNYSGPGFAAFNTLTFNVRNGAGTSGNPVGLQADLAVSAVPEPGTWMLMLLGFGAIGFAMRSRAKTQVRFQFA